MKFRFVALAAAALVASPASSAGFTVYPKISAFADGSTVGGKYVFIRSGVPDGANTLEFREYSVVLRKALAEKGMTEATNPAEATLVIDFNFGIEARSVQTSTPQYGKVGVKSKTEVQNILGQQKLVTKHTPVYGTTGYTTETEATYRRWITVVALDAAAFRASGKLVEKWKLSTESEGVTNDLRIFVPALVYASRPYIGASTGRTIDTKVIWKNKSKDVVAFLGPPPED